MIKKTYPHIEATGKKKNMYNNVKSVDKVKKEMIENSKSSHDNHVATW